MQMTEAFATTAAAVAPVIVLVAVVEMRIYGTRTRDVGLTEARLIEESTQALLAARTEEERNAVITGARRSGVTPTAIASLALSAGWVVVTILLALAEYSSLAFLATETPSPSPVAARRILLSIMLGMFMLIITPLTRWCRDYFHPMFRVFASSHRYWKARKAIRNE
ncbi:hypothetical protein ACH4FX_12390 [Streptomyces sp. NPDC018019]|uniref:hypothetical protein n=1 Tax=Streptomyces sp. NPDC018019 TaxID=3365030 RepID=UPI0037B4BFFC